MQFTDEHRQKALEEKRNRQQIRRKQARELYDTGMPKTKIAKQLGVNYRTISRDLRATE